MVSKETGHFESATTNTSPSNLEQAKPLPFQISVPHALTVGVLMALSFVNHPFFCPCWE